VTGAQRPDGPPRRRRAGRDTGPRRVADSLDDVLEGLGAPSGPRPPSAAALGTVFARWAAVAGPTLARHARPLRLEDGALVVAVDSPPWATQVRALATEILTRLSAETGEPLERLVVVVRA
jgi:predicted nucleic acid-binding Zn ribbon protein